VRLALSVSEIAGEWPQTSNAEPMAAKDTKTPVGMVTAAFGLFTGLASLVLFLGAFTLTWRLRTQGLPAEAVVAVLPREFLISVGVGVTVQLVAFLLALSPAFVWSRVTLVAVASASAGATALAYPFLRIAAGSEWFLLVAAWFVTAIILTGVILWGRSKWGPSRETLPIVILVSVSLLAFGTWRAVFEWQSAQGLGVLVCGKDVGDQANGLFIGENDNSLYIGEKNPPRGGSPRVAEIPRDSIAVVLIGENADEEACQT
jgi:hypothetical protein